MEIFAQRLKELRNSRRVYQKEMAEYLGIDEEFLREYLAYQGILDISL